MLWSWMALLKQSKLKALVPAQELSVVWFEPWTFTMAAACLEPRAFVFHLVAFCCSVHLLIKKKKLNIRWFYYIFFNLLQHGKTSRRCGKWAGGVRAAFAPCTWGLLMGQPPAASLCTPLLWSPNRSSSQKRRSVIWAPVHNETQSEQGFRVRGCPVPRAASFIKSWMWILSLEGTHVPWTGDGWSVAWVAIMMCWLPSLDCCWGVSSLPPKLEELKCHHLAALSGATPCI